MKHYHEVQGISCSNTPYVKYYTASELDMHSPYLERKGIDLADLQRVCASRVQVAPGRMAMFRDKAFQGHHQGNFLYRELVSLTMARVGVERILDQRIDQSGDQKPNDKFVTSGSDTSGFTPIGFDPRRIMSMTGRLVVCAGLAEGYRIHQATGFPVACCVGEANIPKIARQMAVFTRPDKLRISVAADNDRAGRLAALRSGMPYTTPRLEKDFSDVYQHEGGAEAVRWQIEYDFPPLPLGDREKEIERISGRKIDDYAPPMNRLLLEPAGSTPLGVVGVLDVVKPHLINGYDKFKAVAESMGAGPLDHDGHDQWTLIYPGEMGLLMGMMDAGLYTSLQDIPLHFTRLETHFFEAIHEGMVDDVPIPGGPPALVTFGRDDRGACLTVDTDYDQAIARICREAKGFFDKKKDEWRISINTPDQCKRALDALTGNPLRRFMFPSAENPEHWVVGTPWTRHELAGQMPPLLADPAQTKLEGTPIPHHVSQPAL